MKIDDSDNVNWEITLNELSRIKVVISAPTKEDAAHQAYQVYEKTNDDEDLFENIFYDLSVTLLPINIENDVIEVEETEQ